MIGTALTLISGLILSFLVGREHGRRTGIGQGWRRGWSDGVSAAQRHHDRSARRELDTAHPLTAERWPAGAFTHVPEAPALVLNMRRKT